jgi:hypothetical protein
MAIGLIMTFDGVTKEQYETAIGKDGLDQQSPGNPDAANPWPAGILSHHAGPTPTGWAVVDVWEDQAQFDAFAAEHLGPATAKAGIPQPDVVPFEVYNSHTR